MEEEEEEEVYMLQPANRYKQKRWACQHAALVQQAVSSDEQCKQ